VLLKFSLKFHELIYYHSSLQRLLPSAALLFVVPFIFHFQHESGETEATSGNDKLSLKNVKLFLLNLRRNSNDFF
jgi:hypothetical protein